LAPKQACVLLHGKGNEYHELGTRNVIRKIIILAVKTVKFISDRMPYITLRGRWRDNIALNVRVSTEDRIEYVKDRF
jgi:hypothetical protein